MILLSARQIVLLPPMLEERIVHLDNCVAWLNKVKLMNIWMLARRIALREKFVVCNNFRTKMRYYLLLLVFFGIVLSGCSQTVVKYQCADGSFVDSVDLCSAMTCPKVNCPSLDCNACPVKVETKFETTFETITEYQCWDGSVEDDLNSCPKTEIDNQEDCPDFSSLSDRVSCENEESCSFAILNDGGMGKVGEFKLYPWDATPGQFYPYSVAYATVEKEEKKGKMLITF